MSDKLFAETEENSYLINTEMQNSDICFHVDEGATEVLKICQDGSFYVRGKKVTEDIDVYNGFVDFLKSAGFYPNTP